MCCTLLKFNCEVLKLKLFKKVVRIGLVIKMYELEVTLVCS